MSGLWKANNIWNKFSRRFLNTRYHKQNLFHWAHLFIGMMLCKVIQDHYYKVHFNISILKGNSNFDVGWNVVRKQKLRQSLHPMRQTLMKIFFWMEVLLWWNEPLQKFLIRVELFSPKWTTYFSKTPFWIIPFWIIRFSKRAQWWKDSDKNIKPIFSLRFLGQFQLSFFPFKFVT